MRARLFSAPLRCVASLALLAGGALAGCRSEPPKLELTGGTSPATAANAPRAIAFDPPQNATAVDPARTTLTVTFDRAMDREGWAWVVENAATAPEIGESHWDETVRVNTADVRLEPGRSYVVWLNAPQYLYFKDAAGAPLAPVRWTFTTAGAAPGAPAMPVALAPSHPPAAADPPRVVALDPPDGALDVDPATALLRATFDRDMEPSWSWVTEGGDSFPQMTGPARFEADRRTAALPVRLEPGHTYVVWLNSERYRLFRDLTGTPARPLRWSFTTRSSR